MRRRAEVDRASADEGEVLSTLKHLKNGKIEDAIADFAENFFFNDRGLGLEFTDSERLREFFEKQRELYPGSSFQTKKTLVADGLTSRRTALTSCFTNWIEY